MVQRFGRAARDPKIHGFGILYVPPINKAYPSDKHVRNYIMSHSTKKCLWGLLDNMFDNKARTCNNNCSGCGKSDRPFATTGCYNTNSNNKRFPSRSEEEKKIALKALLEWTKVEHERWASDRPYRCGAEGWVLSEKAIKQLSEKFSGARTAAEVKTIVYSTNCRPREETRIFEEIAQLLDKVNNEVNARRGSSSQTAKASALDQFEDNSDSGEDLLES
jgi:hypothetical protein